MIITDLEAGSDEFVDPIRYQIEVMEGELNESLE